LRGAGSIYAAERNSIEYNFASGNKKAALPLFLVVLGMF